MRNRNTLTSFFAFVLNDTLGVERWGGSDATEVAVPTNKPSTNRAKQIEYVHRTRMQPKRAIEAEEARI